MHGNYYQWRFDAQIKIPDGERSFDDLVGVIDPYANIRLDLTQDILVFPAISDRPAFKPDNGNLDDTSNSNLQVL